MATAQDKAVDDLKNVLHTIQESGNTMYSSFESLDPQIQCERMETTAAEGTLIMVTAEEKANNILLKFLESLMAIKSSVVKGTQLIQYLEEAERLRITSAEGTSTMAAEHDKLINQSKKWFEKLRELLEPIKIGLGELDQALSEKVRRKRITSAEAVGNEKLGVTENKLEIARTEGPLAPEDLKSLMQGEFGKTAAEFVEQLSQLKIEE